MTAFRQDARARARAHTARFFLPLALRYGRCFYDDDTELEAIAEEMVDVGKKLRVMNAMRSYEVGVPISSKQ